MTTTLINLTPHAVTIVVGETHITLQPSKDYPLPRLSVNREPAGTLAGIPIVRPTLGAPENLPPVQPDTAYIVSALVAETAKRPDLYSPGELVRDDQGVIVGCKGLCTYSN